MAGTWKEDRLPRYREAIHRLTEQHLELVDEPLRLAIFYHPGARDPRDVFLFEVVDGLGESVNPDRDLFEVTFASSSGFPMGPNEQLHLILTNVQELEVALREDWPLASELVNAIREGDAEVSFKDDVGERILALLQAESRREVTAGG